MINDVKLRFYWTFRPRPFFSPNSESFACVRSSKAASLWSLSSWWSLERPTKNAFACVRHQQLHFHFHFQLRLHRHRCRYNHRHKTFFHSWSRCVFLSLCVSCIYSYDKKAFQSFSSLFYDPANGFGAFLDDEKLFLRHTKSSVSGFFKRGLAEKWLCFKYNNKSRLKDGMENRRGGETTHPRNGRRQLHNSLKKSVFFFRFLLVLLFSPVRRLQSQSQPTDESQST